MACATCGKFIDPFVTDTKGFEVRYFDPFNPFPNAPVASMYPVQMANTVPVSMTPMGVNPVRTIPTGSASVRYVPRSGYVSYAGGGVGMGVGDDIKKYINKDMMIGVIVGIVLALIINLVIRK